MVIGGSVAAGYVGFGFGSCWVGCLKQHIMKIAAYNQWANGRLYDAAADLGEDELGRDVGAVFGSMLGTLNHLLAVDRVWMKRFTGEGDAPTNTAAILYDAL